jgi:hypothetical protein
VNQTFIGTRYFQ